MKNEDEKNNWWKINTTKTTFKYDEDRKRHLGDFPGWLPSYEVKSGFFLVPGKMRPPSPVPPKTLFVAKIMPNTVDNFLKASALKPLGPSKSTNVKIISPVVPHGFFVDIFV